MTLDALWGNTSFDEKLNKKYIAEKDDFEILRWPYVTFNDLHTLFYEKNESSYF